MHLILPMAGGGTRFLNQGFQQPKPLIPIAGKPFFYWATESIRSFVPLTSLTFAVLQDHITHFQIDSIIRSFYPNSRIVVIPQLLNGPVLTALHAIDSIQDSAPILFNDCDHLFYAETFYEFCNHYPATFQSPYPPYQIPTPSLNGCLLTFLGLSQKYSFAELDSEGFVSQTVEKQAINQTAICGAYWFKNASVFKAATQTYLNNPRYNEFFMSGVFNHLPAKTIIQFPVQAHLSFGTPEEYENAKKSRLFQLIQS